MMDEREYEIDLRELFEIIKKRFWMIMAITIAAASISAIVSFYLLTPVYETRTTLIVVKAANPEQAIQYNDVILSQKLVKTYGEIVKSRTLAKRVIENLNLDMTVDRLIDLVTVSSVQDTEIISIKVTNTDPVLIRKIANELAAVFMENITQIMRIDNVQVIDPAETPQKPVRPRPVMNIAIAGILGFMIGVGLAFLLEYLDDTLKTPEDIERHLKLPVIGAIPYSPENAVKEA